MSDAALIQAQAHARAGRPEQALQLVKRLLEKQPANHDCLNLAIEVLCKLKRHDQAIFLVQKAIAASPFDAELHRMGADTELHRGRYKEAEAGYRASLAIEPSHFKTQVDVGQMLYHQGSVDEAKRYFRAMHESAPGSTNVLLAYAALLDTLGDLDEAVQLLKNALAHSPANDAVLERLMIPLARMHDADPREIFNYHVKLGRLFTEKMSHLAAGFANARDPERSLRIGYCSQDFRNRSVGHFIEPILTHHDKSKFQVVLYHDVINEDEMTAWLRARSAMYVPTHRMTSEQFVATVRSHGIDILIDLSGYTGSRHAIALAAKPAPLMYTYLGYPNTTGLPAMDFRIVDAHTDPPGSEHLATESLVRMDGSFLCYAPPPHAGDVAPPPRQKNGFVTFGSFNTITKVGNPVLEVWAEILNRVPRSRLVLKAAGLSSVQTQGRILAFLRSRGIEQERVSLFPETKSKAEHLQMYSQIDIALDTWPYNGTTTTVEALYMGTPVVGLAGNSHVSRVGVSILNNVGLADLVATDKDAYLERAVALAADADRCAELRARLRSMVLASSLCDHAGFTKRLEAHYRQAWRGWCQRTS
ncbi:MAG: tetratricopeptide repeat protein [Phycisphaeraceae bacterium]|nr:tetratricopeptide repeat protein [Phycisphaeraceae bacterium]